MAEELFSEIQKREDDQRERAFNYERLVSAKVNYTRACEALAQKVARGEQTLAALADLATACAKFPDNNVEAVVRSLGDSRTLGSVGFTTRTYGSIRTFLADMVSGTRDREETRLADYRTQLATARERLENAVDAIRTFEATTA